MLSLSRNITPVRHKITLNEREERLRQRGAVIWLTGLPASGKSTISMELERRLFDAGIVVYTLDGDNVRHGLNSNLGFSPDDRKENIRRVGEVAALFADAGLVCITAFISPYRADRTMARTAVRRGSFYEVYVKASIETCERRDPKGLYAKARRGELKEMTGVDAPYEVPEAPDLVLDTENRAIEQSVQELYEFVRTKITLS
ncbi:MAG: adenylyl-sulfate kinase [Burkholderiales bacterium]|nr:adenylyl-sulfate kinase [Burkholderiales bacterium]